MEEKKEEEWGKKISGKKKKRDEKGGNVPPWMEELKDWEGVERRESKEKTWEKERTKSIEVYFLLSF